MLYRAPSCDVIVTGRNAEWELTRQGKTQWEKLPARRGIPGLGRGETGKLQIPLETEERNRMRHARRDVGAKMRDLVVYIREEGETCPSTLLHDGNQIAAIELHCHRTAGPQGVRSHGGRGDALAVQLE